MFSCKTADFEPWSSSVASDHSANCATIENCYLLQRCFADSANSQLILVRFTENLIVSK